MQKISIRLAAGVCAALTIGVQSLAGLERAAQGGAAHDHASAERIARLTKALGIGPGSMVADVGAGGGDYTVKLAREVGAAGRVYAVDVSPSALTRLRTRIASEKLDTVQVIEGAAADPRLPAGALDGALIVNAYHEMTEYASMLQRIREALKPGGRLVILEPIADGARAHGRDQQTRQHQIAPEIVIREVRAAGFDIVALEDPFKPSRAHSDHSEWLLVAVPSQPPVNSRLQPATSNLIHSGLWRLKFGVETVQSSRLIATATRNTVRFGRSAL